MKIIIVGCGKVGVSLAERLSAEADLIQKGGIVGKKDESLVALQNGCICCTLKMDLVEQIDYKV